jgi:hypothetical protein
MAKQNVVDPRFGDLRTTPDWTNRCQLAFASFLLP